MNVMGSCSFSYSCTMVCHLHPQMGQRMLREEVTAADIAEVTAKWTGIPVAQLLAPEREKLLHLPEALHQRVVGQDQAVDAVADAIQRCTLRGFVIQQRLRKTHSRQLRRFGSQLLAPQREKLLHRRVVGQDQAVDAVADAIQRCLQD